MALQVLPFARDHGFGSLKLSLGLATVIWIVGLGIIILALLVVVAAALGIPLSRLLRRRMEREATQASDLSQHS